MSWKPITVILILSFFSPLIISEYEEESLQPSVDFFTGGVANSLVDSAGKVGEYNSIDIDSNGNPHISYFDDTNNALKYAKFDGNNWLTSDIQNETYGVFGEGTSIKIDSIDNIHLAYSFHGAGITGSESGIRYAHYDGNIWSITNVTSDASSYPSIEVDSNFSPHISYLGGNNLMYAKLVNGFWEIDTVDNGCNPEQGNSDEKFGSLKLDSNGNPHIAYQRITSGTSIGHWDLKYASYDGTGWSKVTVDNSGSEAGKNPSLILDENDHPHIASGTKGGGSSQNRDALTYSTNNGNGWINTVIYGGGSNSAWNPSIAIDSLSNLHISFIGAYSNGNGDIRLATNYGSNWGLAVVVGNLENPSNVRYLHNSVDDSNDVHISYNDYRTYDLMYSKFESNHAPVITSLEVTSEGEIYVGREDPVVFTVEATDDGITDSWQFDVDWTINGNSINCQESTGLVCTTYGTATLTDLPGLNVVRATVYDNHMASETREISVIIWNTATATDLTPSGIEVEYSLKYNSSSPFTINIFDADINNEHTNISLPGFRGKYNATGVIGFTPSFEYEVEDVLEQSLQIIHPKNLSATSLWHFSDLNEWTLLSDDLQAYGNEEDFVAMFEHDFPSNTSVLSNGVFVMISENLIPVEETPEAYAVDVFFEQGTAGQGRNTQMFVRWGISGVKLDTDFFSITICLYELNCENPISIQNVSYSNSPYTLQEEHHGIVHHVSVSLCNSGDCSDPATSSFVADVKIDPPVQVFNVTLHYESPEWASFLIFDPSSISLLTWDHSSDISDVHGWRICYSEEPITLEDEWNFSSNDDCKFVDGNLNYTFIPTSTGKSYTIHVNIAPYDEFNNGMDWVTSSASQQITYPYAMVCFPGNLRNFTVILPNFGGYENYEIFVPKLKSQDSSISMIKCGINLFDYLPEGLSREELHQFGLSYSSDMTVEARVNTTWGNFSRIIGYSNQVIVDGEPLLGVIDPSANVESLTAFEPQWEKSGPVELSILISNPSDFLLSPVIQCRDSMAEIPTSYQIPNETIEPGEQSRFYIYLDISNPGIHDIECNLIPPVELPYMQTNQGFATINYVYNGSDSENSQDTSNNNNQMEQDSRDTKNTQIPLLEISVGMLTLLVCVVLIVLKIRKRNDDEEFSEEMEEYENLTNQSYDSNLEVQNNEIEGIESEHIPPFDYQGEVNEDGWEICEYPQGSKQWWWKDYDSESWVLWE